MESLPINNLEELTTLIPQKHPFVMVDQLISYSETALISGLTIKSENILLENGFLSASGLIEHQAQSVALHTGYSFFLKGEIPPTGYIGSIKKSEIFSLPKIGESISSEVEILNELMGVTLVDIKTKNQKGEIIAISQMKTVIK